MEKKSLMCIVVALNLVTAGAGCSSARGDERHAANAADGSGDSVTIAGCLSAGPEGRFALTAAPDATVSTAARAMDNERDTHTYMLVGGDDLQSHLGKRVEVIGTVSGKTQEIEQKDSNKTAAAPAVSGGDTPTVKTKEEIDVEIRQLNVRQIRDLAPTCAINP